jgi:hypothetical protein
MSFVGRFAIGILAAAFACPAHSTTTPVATAVLWEPPQIDWPDHFLPATIPKEMIGTLRVAAIPITLEETKLEDVRKQFGATIGSRGDAGDSERRMCLYRNDANKRWILWLTSDEIDGPVIGGFQWRSLSPNEKPDRRCRLLRKDSGGIELPLALHLAMSEADLVKILGKPTMIRDNTIIFCHEHREIIDKQSYVSSNSIAVVLRGKLA